MKTTMTRMTGSVRMMTLAVMVLAGAAGVGVLTPSAALAQVKSVADVKTLVKPELPANALEITAAMKSAKVGETITVRGNVAMSKDAFVENRAMFTLVDESTRKGCCPPSDTLPDTACDIPAQGRATVQIVDAGGRPLRAGLNGQHGLKPGAEVFVTGKVLRPGPYPITQPTTVLQMLAMAGGTSDFAKTKKIAIMRTENGQTRSFKFNYSDVLQGKKLEQNILLLPGDTIVVP